MTEVFSESNMFPAINYIIRSAKISLGKSTDHCVKRDAPTLLIAEIERNQCNQSVQYWELELFWQLYYNVKKHGLWGQTI